MTGCCIKGCNNSTKKGFKFFTVPVDKKRREEWLQLIGRDTLGKKASVCEVYFDINQFEQHRKDGRKLLRPFGKPNLLRTSENERDERRFNPQEDNSEQTTDLSIVQNINSCEYESNTTTNNSCSVNGDNTNKEITTNNTNKEKTTNNTNKELTTNTVLSDTASNHKTYAKRLVTKLKKKLKTTVLANNIMKKKLRQVNSMLNRLINDDQKYFLHTGSCRGRSWSTKTITKALRLYVACGQKGYEEIRKQIPYPSIRCLQHRIQGLKFKPGIFEDIFNLLKIKIETFNSEEKHAVLLMDEMSIKPGLQYDNSIAKIVGRPTMKLSGGFDSSSKLATHSLVFMLCGISTKWKQAVGYKLTENSFCSQEMFDKIIAIIKRAHDIGLTIKVIVSDMGPQNRSWWRNMNITAGKFSKINNYIEHPCNKQEKLYVTADSVHVYKNVACALISGTKFYLSETLVRKYNLPSNEISILPVREVFNLDKKDTLKLCPHLKESVINPSHFDKMNVALSVSLLNDSVAAAITYHIANKNIDAKHKTTAWFLSLMYKWFKLLTSRYHKLALSRYQTDVYKKNISFLQDFIEIIRGITTGDGKWKPYQSGLLLCTQTVLDLQAEYLEKYNFKYLLLGRFTQDALENLFSLIRARKAVPDVREFKTSLRLVCLSQFQCNINRGNYSVIESEHMIEYCNELKQLNSRNISVEDKCIEEIQNVCDDEIYKPLLENEKDLSDASQASLYYLIGAILSKIKKNLEHCDHCFNSLLTDSNHISDSNNNNNLNLYTRLREYKENILFFPSMDIYNMIYKCELLFRKNENILILNMLPLTDFIDRLLNDCAIPSIPSCHNIIFKLVKNFVITRIHFSLKKKSYDI